MTMTGKITPMPAIDARVHRMPPGPDRRKERSRTYQGIADAMADQWGALFDDERAAA